eukprot:scaffold12643_cov136-Cyclotella_meneghiniana.AAC.1
MRTVVSWSEPLVNHNESDNQLHFTDEVVIAAQELELMRHMTDMKISFVSEDMSDGEIEQLTAGNPDELDDGMIEVRHDVLGLPAVDEVEEDDDDSLPELIEDNMLTRNESRPEVLTLDEEIQAEIQAEVDRMNELQDQLAYMRINTRSWDYEDVSGGDEVLLINWSPSRREPASEGTIMVDHSREGTSLVWLRDRLGLTTEENQDQEIPSDFTMARVSNNRFAPLYISDDSASEVSEASAHWSEASDSESKTSSGGPRHADMSPMSGGACNDFSGQDLAVSDNYSVT